MRIAPVVSVVLLLALAGCGVPGGPTNPTSTGFDGGTGDGDQSADGDKGGDPFPPDFPTTSDGWGKRYVNLPWLSDDLDNDDYFITGTVDGHDVIGFICAAGPEGWATAVDGSYVEVHFNPGGDFSTTVLRQKDLVQLAPSGNEIHYDITYSGLGTWTSPSETQGSSTVSPSVEPTIEHSFEYNGLTEMATATTAVIEFEFLGVPASSFEECEVENDSLWDWAYSMGGNGAP